MPQWTFALPFKLWVVGISLGCHMICIGQKEKNEKPQKCITSNFCHLVTSIFSYALLKVCRIISEFSREFYRSLFIKCFPLLFSVVCDGVVHLQNLAATRRTSSSMPFSDNIKASHLYSQLRATQIGSIYGISWNVYKQSTSLIVYKWINNNRNWFLFVFPWWCRDRSVWRRKVGSRRGYTIALFSLTRDTLLHAVSLSSQVYCWL